MLFVYALDPGTGSSPYHYECAEEGLLVVEGTLVLLFPVYQELAAEVS
jgi:uncharacterized cupin superfamily protein